MNKIIIIGTIPPPIGGVTIHLDRFLNLFDEKEYEIGIFDIKKQALYRKDKNKSTNNIFTILKFFFSSKVVHVHISNNLKLFISIASKLLLKKVIYTHHNSIVKNKFVFKFLYKLCDRVILVNDAEIDKALIIENKTKIIPAFLPAYELEDLPQSLKDEIDKYNNVISTNCYFYNLYNGKHVYGFDLIIKAFYNLSKAKKIENTLLVFVDPSATTKENVSNLLDGLDFDTNKVLHITEKVDFASLIKKSTLTIRATRTDGDSLSIRESLYFGIPIIASNVTWRPKGTIIFKNEDIHDLGEKIVEAMHDRKKPTYNNQNYGEMVIKLYEDVLQKKSNKIQY